MKAGPDGLDYEYRPYNPERMRNERVARAQAALKKHDLGAMVLYDYDYHRTLTSCLATWTRRPKRSQPYAVLRASKGAAFAPLVPNRLTRSEVDYALLRMCVPPWVDRLIRRGISPSTKLIAISSDVKSADHEW